MGELLRHLLHTLDGPIPTALGFVIVAVRYSLLTVIGTATFAVLSIVQIFWRATLGKAFRAVGGVVILGQHPLGALKTADAAVEHYLARGMAWSERSIVYSLNQLVDTFAILIAVPVAIALALAELTQWTAGKLRHVATRKEVTHNHTTVTKKVTVVRGVTQAQLVTLQKKVKVLAARVALATRTAPARVVTPIPRLKRVETKVKTLEKRTSRLERIKLAPVAIVAAALASTKLGLGWLRCRNVQRTGRQVCETPTDVMTDLLLSLAVIGVALNIRDFTRAMQAIADPVADVLTDMVTGPETEGSTPVRAN